MRTLFVRLLAWSALIAVLAGVTVAAFLRFTPGVDELRDYGPVPDFTLVERSGATVSLGDLQGAVWIADFIFTRCGSTCPLMTSRMSDVEQRVADTGLRFVSITVDPEYDTPEVLAEFADRYQAPAERWLFLSGDKRAIYTLIKGGFHLGVEDVSERTNAATEAVASADEEWDADQEPFIHSTRFVLVDRTGHIRGYYDGTDAAAMQKLLRDSSRLLAESDAS